MHSLTIIETNTKYGRTSYDVIEEITEIPITAESEDRLFAIYFREYKNRHKYINRLHYRIKEPDLQSKYNDWIGIVDNYANNGGDMW
jgi:hypothetical protein